MKNLFSIFAVVALMSLVSCGAEEATDNNTEVSKTDASETESSLTGTFTIDPANSVVKWQGGMIAAYHHEGTIAVSEGSFEIKDDQVTSGSITIDMTTMAAVDENFNKDAGQTREGLAGHLMSADFFDVENHPTATFVVDAAGSGAVAGQLTIRGVSENVKIAKLSVNAMDNGVAIRGKFIFDRQVFGVAHQNSMSDLVISDEVEMTFRIIGN